MKKIGLFWGSDTGNTETVAGMIAESIGEELVDVYDISQCSPEDILQYDYLIFGIPTWGNGELQSDWEDFFPNLSEMDFSGKTVALFGLGDQFTYSSYFLDAMGMLHDEIVPQGVKIVGHWPTEGYEFEESKAIVDGNFVGLAIDQDNQDDLTPERVQLWVEQLNELVPEMQQQD